MFSDTELIVGNTYLPSEMILLSRLKTPVKNVDQKT